MSALSGWVRSNGLLLVFMIGLALAWTLLRTHPTEGVDSLQSLDAALLTGRPTVLEFYSNFCSTCLVARPMVDGLEQKLVDKARVIRLDVLSRVGRQAAARYGVRGVPTLVVVDGSGQVVYGQAGIPHSQPVIAQVEALLTSK